MFRVRVLSGLIGLGVMVGFAGGQQPPLADKPNVEKKEVKKGTLEDAITIALRSNPDVRVAEAEVQVAQAKLSQAKLTVAQKVASSHAAIERAKAEVKAAEENFSRIAQLVKKGFAPQEQLSAVQLKLESAKAAVATAEAEYNAVLGVMPGKSAEASATWLRAFVDERGSREANSLLLPLVRNELQPWVYLDRDAAAKVSGTVADKLRTGLNKEIVVLSDGKNLQEFLDWLNGQAQLNVTFRVLLTSDLSPAVTIKESNMSVGAVLQLIEDERASMGLRMVIRDYGILVTDAKTLPPGAVTVQEFWKQIRAEKAKEKEKVTPKN